MCRSDDTINVDEKNNVGSTIDGSFQENVDSLMGDVDVADAVSPVSPVSSSSSSLSSLSLPAATKPTDRDYAIESIESSTSLQQLIPNVVWIDHILPFLDRPAWNALMEASKELYVLTALSKLTADYQNIADAARQRQHQHQNQSYTQSQTQNQNQAAAFVGVRRARAAAIIQPPWPTNRPFLSRLSGGQGQAIESVSISHDGEYLACGSVIGTIELWNLRTGKVTWKTRRTTENPGDSCNRSHNYKYYGGSERNDDPGGNSSGKGIVPMGSLLKFSPVRHVLACGFEHKIVLWDLSGAVQEHRKQSTCSRKRSNIPTGAYREEDRDPPFSAFRTTLEIDCRKGKIYEVTYLEFSHDARRLIARYGKTAYVWTLSPSPSRSPGAGNEFGGDHAAGAGASASAHCLTHTIPLVSSRSLVVLDPVRMRLALATHGSSGSNSSNNDNDSNNGSNGNRNNTNRSEGRSTGRAGLVHVWDLPEPTETNTDENPVATVVTGFGNNCCSGSGPILAYRNHVVRGLDFLRLGSSNANATTTAGAAATSTSLDGCLVTASLQGEIKFWKRKEQASFYNYNYSNDNDSDDSHYVCVFRFQSPGKIFSLASWSSPLPEDSFLSSSRTQGKNASVFLAAGEAKGGVRVWKVHDRERMAASQSDPDHAHPRNDGDADVEACQRDNAHKDSRSHSHSHSYPYPYLLNECLSTQVGDHVHYDNIKMVSFTPNGRSLVVSRAYDAKVWFQTIWQ